MKKFPLKNEQQDKGMISCRKCYQKPKDTAKYQNTVHYMNRWELHDGGGHEGKQQAEAVCVLFI